MYNDNELLLNHLFIFAW